MNISMYMLQAIMFYVEIANRFILNLSYFNVNSVMIIYNHINEYI